MILHKPVAVMFIMHFTLQHEEALEFGVTGNRYRKTVSPVLFRGKFQCNGNDAGNLAAPQKSPSYKYAFMGETYCHQQNASPLDGGGGCGDTV
jgi:hypothetical protein